MMTSPASAQEISKVDRDIGPPLRARREQRGISLRRLAKSIGISASALSQIETSRSKPSVTTLYALVSELGISLDELFLGEGNRVRNGTSPPPGRVRGAERQDAADRKTLTMESGVVWERLTPTHEPDVDFLYVTYEVGGASSRDGAFIHHNGREYGLVLEGNLRVTVGFEAHDLGPGDSIAFDSSVPHRLENTGEAPARAVWVALGRYASDPRSEGLQER